MREHEEPMNTPERPPWRQLYDSMNLDADILALFDDDKIALLCVLAGPRARAWSARRGIRSAVRNYLWARFLFPERAAGAAEWSRMLRVAETGERFARELSGLMTSGDAQKRVLIDPLDSAFVQHPEQRSLFRALAERGDPGSILRQIKTLVDLIALGARNAVVIAEGEDVAERRADYHEKVAWITTPGDKRNLDKACLLEGTKAFARYWRAVSDNPFNAGKYYPETGRHIGAAVEAMHLVFSTIDPTLTERRIATAIRDFGSS